MDQNSFDAPPAGTEFDEDWYLRQNADVAEGVRNGGFRSGWHHYVLCGRTEGREPVPRWQTQATEKSTIDEGIDKSTLVQLAYKMLLGREELNNDIIAQQSHFTDIFDLRHQFLSSQEAIDNERLKDLAKLLYRNETAVAQSTREFELFIRQTPEIEQMIVTITNEVSKTDTYAYFHAKRFRDQISAVAALRQKRFGHLPSVRLLDIGQSAVTHMYCEVIPGIELYTANLQNSANAEEEMAKYQSKYHYFIDLDYEELSAKYTDLASDQFDIIVYCEVLEHIRATPEEQIQDLLNILAPHGALIISTPNALNFNQLASLAFGRKSDTVYRRGQRHLYEQHHIHVREFTIAEMLEAVSNARGEVMMIGVSDYYSEPRGNLVRLDYVSSRQVQTLIVVHPRARTGPHER